MAKQKPTGFVAICQCGNIVGALDYRRTDRVDAGKLLGAWLSEGCTIKPRFDTGWGTVIKPCECES